MQNLVLFLLCSVGIFLIFDLKPRRISDDVFNYVMSDKNKKLKGIKSQVNVLMKKKKDNILKRQILETENLLKITKKEKLVPFVFMCSLFLSVLGFLIGSAFENIWLGIVLCIGLLLVPFWAMEINSWKMKKEISEEMETALSVITSSYIRNESIVKSVEENIEYINEPILGFFKEFLADFNSNNSIENALFKMKDKFENQVFCEWVDAMIFCQNDRTLKATLLPIVSKLSDIRIVNSRAEALYSSARQEFFAIVGIIIIIIPVIKNSMEEFKNVFDYQSAKIALAILIAVIFISTYFVMKITKPVEYK